MKEKESPTGITDKAIEEAILLNLRRRGILDEYLLKKACFPKTERSSTKLGMEQERQLRKRIQVLIGKGIIKEGTQGIELVTLKSR